MTYATDVMIVYLIRAVLQTRLPVADGSEFPVWLLVWALAWVPVLPAGLAEAFARFEQVYHRARFLDFSGQDGLLVIGLPLPSCAQMECNPVAVAAQISLDLGR